MFSFRFKNLAPLWQTQHRGLALIPALIRTAPLPSFMTILLVLAAGIGEGIGLTFFAPLLTSAGLQSGDRFSQAVFASFRNLGVEPSTGAILILIAVAFLIKGGLQLWANLAIGYAGTTFSTRLRVELVRSLLRAQWSIFTSQSIGSLANSISTDTSRAASAVTSAYQITAFAIQLLVYFVLSFAISWQGTLAALAGGTTLFLIMHYFVHISAKAGKQQQKVFERLLSRLVDQFGMVKPIRAMGAEKRLLPYLEADILQLDSTQRQLVHSKASLTTLNEPIMISLLCLGAWLAMSLLGMAMAELLVLGMIFYRSAGRLSALQSAHQTLVSSQEFLVALLQLLKRTHESAERQSGTQAPTLDSGIRFNDVTFDYGAGHVLQGACLDIKARQITALIGPSGSGKTSILDLVLGLHRPREGEVLIDDVRLDEIDLHAWRSRIGYVPQDTVLLNDSILANVALGDPGVSREEVMEALRLADADSFVQNMMGGIDASAGERGMQLSGGQRQRIALARALVRKPLLLVLDEPTSALDTASATAFCSTLRTLSGKLTVIVVSHQFDVAMASDTIYEMKEGRAEARAGAEAMNIMQPASS